MRAFLALLPDPDTALAIERWRDRNWRALGHPTAVQNLHLTLAFLGDIDADRVRALGEALDRPLPDCGELCFDRVSWQGRSQMLWLETAAAPTGLSALVTTCRHAAQRVGIGVGSERYTPHITLARRVDVAPPPLIDPDFRWRPSAVTLLHSRLMPDGPLYTPVAQWPLIEGLLTENPGDPGDD